MIAASTAALLGTSQVEEPRTSYRFTKQLDKVDTELTAEAPSRRYLVKLRATALSTADIATTDAAQAIIVGTVEASGIDGATGAASVEVTLLPRGESKSSIQAARSFETSAALAFTGDCPTPQEKNPCQSELAVELKRLDNGTEGGSLSVSWQVRLENTASAVGDATDVVEELPWTVEVTEP